MMRKHKQLTKGTLTLPVCQPRQEKCKYYLTYGKVNYSRLDTCTTMYTNLPCNARLLTPWEIGKNNNRVKKNGVVNVGDRSPNNEKRQPHMY